MILIVFNSPLYLLNRIYFRAMDALSSILDSIKLKGVVYQKTSFSARWGVAVGQDSNSQFWRLIKGTCYVRVPGEPVIKMSEGDFVYVPHGSAHLISGEADSACVPSAQYVQSLQCGEPMFQGNDEETVLIGGHFEFVSDNVHPFLRSLPKVIRIDNSNTALTLWLQQIASFMNEEVSGARLGGSMILGRLAEVLFILIIRVYLQQANIEKGFLLALKDPRISDSLKLMHEQPEKDWTLEQLATSVGMSRSLYCKEFKRLTGETPLGYLTNWRILKAKEFLTEKKSNISEVAEKVGYQSEAAFNRLFKAKIGETPVRYRNRVMG